MQKDQQTPQKKNQKDYSRSRSRSQEKNSTKKKIIRKEDQLDRDREKSQESSRTQRAESLFREESKYVETPLATLNIEEGFTSFRSSATSDQIAQAIDITVTEEFWLKLARKVVDSGQVKELGLTLQVEDRAFTQSELDNLTREELVKFVAEALKKLFVNPQILVLLKIAGVNQQGIAYCLWQVCVGKCDLLIQNPGTKKEYTYINWSNRVQLNYSQVSKSFIMKSSPYDGNVNSVFEETVNQLIPKFYELGMNMPETKEETKNEEKPTAMTALQKLRKQMDAKNDPKKKR